MSRRRMAALGPKSIHNLCDRHASGQSIRTIAAATGSAGPSRSAVARAICDYDMITGVLEQLAAMLSDPKKSEAFIGDLHHQATQAMENGKRSACEASANFQHLLAGLIVESHAASQEKLGRPMDSLEQYVRACATIHADDHAHDQVDEGVSDAQIDLIRRKILGIA